MARTKPPTTHTRRAPGQRVRDAATRKHPVDAASEPGVWTRMLRLSTLAAEREAALRPVRSAADGAAGGAAAASVQEDTVEVSEDSSERDEGGWRGGWRGDGRGGGRGGGREKKRRCVLRCPDCGALLHLAVAAAHADGAAAHTPERSAESDEYSSEEHGRAAARTPARWPRLAMRASRCAPTR